MQLKRTEPLTICGWGKKKKKKKKRREEKKGGGGVVLRTERSPMMC